MKKIIIFIIVLLWSFLITTNIYGIILSNEKSSYWNSNYATTNFSHVGSYRENLPRINEGVMFYEAANIYDYEISNDVYIGYVGVLYPEVVSSNYIIDIGIGTIRGSYVVPPTSASIEVTFGMVNSSVDIDQMNIGFGIKRTYSEILYESDINKIKYHLQPGASFIEKYISPDELFSSGNGTIAIYAKTMRVKEHLTKIRQTGPIWNVYWTTIGYQVKEFEVLVDLSLFPITYQFRNSNFINHGGFYNDQLSPDLQNLYKPK